MIDIEKGRYWDLPWSVVDGCSPCSPGCDHCWSAAMTKRFHPYEIEGHNAMPLITDRGEHFNGRIVTHIDRLSIPLKRRKPTVYAVWNDLFHGAVQFDFHKVAYKTMIESRRHTFLVLSKRPNKMLSFHNDLKYFNLEITPNPLPLADNIYHGLTVCNQQEADEKVPIFLQVPGTRFLSIEPMLGPIDLQYSAFNGSDSIESLEGIHAVILGGETGPGARPMHPDWVRSIRDQCAAASVLFFFKGWGNWRPCDDDHVECGGHVQTAMRLNGKIVTDTWRDRCLGGSDQGFWRAGAKAGRLLDGRTHDDLPWRT